MSNYGKVLCFTKTMLFCMNFLFLLAGVIMFALGLWIHINAGMAFTYVTIIHYIPSSWLIPKLAHGLMVIGSICTLVSFLGCCGAWAESTCFIATYTVLVVLVLISQIVLVIMGIVYSSEIRHNMFTTMNHQIRYEYNRTLIKTTGQPRPLTLVWDHMQIQFKCCGVTGPEDYLYSSWYNSTKHSLLVPPTCCTLIEHNPITSRPKRQDICHSEALTHQRMLSSGNVTSQLPVYTGSRHQSDTAAYNFNSTIIRDGRYPPASHLNTKGCKFAVKEWMSVNMNAMVMVTTLLILMQIFGMVLSCVMVARVRRHREKYPWYIDSEDE